MKGGFGQGSLKGGVDPGKSEGLTSRIQREIIVDHWHSGMGRTLGASG